MASLGWQSLQGAVEDAGGPTGADTRLHLDLTGRDPDAGMTDIAYEKGAAFLRTMEQAVGRERWDAYLRSYFDRNAFKPMTTEQLLADIRANLIRGDAALEQRIGLDAWVGQPGIPANAVVPRSGAFARVEAQAQAFARGTAAGQLQTQGWTTQEWQHFLGALPQTLPAARLADLDRAFGLSRQGNSEILFAWLQMAVRNRYEPALPALERFLTTQGRRKFVRPLFSALMEQGEWGRGHARRIYAIARPGYHPVTSGSVDAIVR
ncbi:MAG TPA: leukotriene A4 hydrolase C-terminal domain-containing protein [Longimicrobium sp.]